MEGTENLYAKCIVTTTAESKQLHDTYVDSHRLLASLTCNTFIPQLALNFMVMIKFEETAKVTNSRSYEHIFETRCLFSLHAGSPYDNWWLFFSYYKMCAEH